MVGMLAQNLIAVSGKCMPQCWMHRYGLVRFLLMEVDRNGDDRQMRQDDGGSKVTRSGQVQHAEIEQAIGS